MDIVEADAAGEQWHTRAAPTCWYSAEVGWTASSCAPHRCMPTDAAVGSGYFSYGFSVSVSVIFACNQNGQTQNCKSHTVAMFTLLHNTYKYCKVQSLRRICSISKATRQGCPMSRIVPTVHFKKSSLLQLLGHPVPLPCRQMSANRNKTLSTCACEAEAASRVTKMAKCWE